MIPERNTVTVDSTVQGEDVRMSVDETALAHIMNILTDLYADPELAVIREYSTNALDSHMEVGQTRPIEVTTPTHLRPVFTVRDFGVGLDADDIRDIYSRYGASTKRATNDAVGMLGLGCKSALAYVDQFTLAGIKGGERILVSIARDEMGAGTMTVLEAGPTDEPEGVEVCVPVSDHSEFEGKAEDFFSYWAPGTVLLNGKEPHELSGFPVGETFLVADRDTDYGATGTATRKLSIVMGNVSYPPPEGFESDIISELPNDKRLVVRVPIGAVNFTPSRESLQDSERTQRAIHAALAPFPEQAAAAAREAVEFAPNRPAAAKALIEARQAFGKANVPDVMWKGEDIPTIISAEDLPAAPGKSQKASLWALGNIGSYRGAESYRSPARQITLDAAGANPWVLGFSNATWTAAMRRKLNRYLEHHELSDSPGKATIYLTDAPALPCPEWIDGAVVAVQWEDVRAWKDPLVEKATGGGSGKYAGTYPVFHQGRYFGTFKADELPKSGRDLYFMDGGKWTDDQEAAAFLLSNDAYLVCLEKSRAAKFERNFPHAREALPCVRAAAEGWLTSRSEGERRAIAVWHAPNSRSIALGANLADEQIDDPILATLFKAAAALQDSNIKSEWEMRRRFVDKARWPTMADVGLVNWSERLDKYPLVTRLGIWGMIDNNNKSHVILYINAVYAAEIKEDK